MSIAILVVRTGRAAAPAGHVPAHFSSSELALSPPPRPVGQPWVVTSLRTCFGLADRREEGSVPVSQSFHELLLKTEDKTAERRCVSPWLWLVTVPRCPSSCRPPPSRLVFPPCPRSPFQLPGPALLSLSTTGPLGVPAYQTLLQEASTVSNCSLFETLKP